MNIFFEYIQIFLFSDIHRSLKFCQLMQHIWPCYTVGHGPTYAIFGQNGFITTGKQKGERKKKHFIIVSLFLIIHIPLKNFT